MKPTLIQISLIQISLPAVLLATSAIAPALGAQEPVLRELVCRGGASGLQLTVVADPSPDNPEPSRMVRMSLRYTPSTSFISGEPSTLAAGSCGWDMRFSPIRPPGQVTFDIEADFPAVDAATGATIAPSENSALTYPDTASMRRYLSSPLHFWVFYVFDQGSDFATSHMAGDPASYNVVAVEKGAEKFGEPNPAAKPSEKLKAGGDRTRELLSNVAKLNFKQVDRTLNSFTIRFTARPGVHATVNYSTEEPILAPNGMWFFQGATPDGSGRLPVGGLSAAVREVQRTTGMFSEYAATTQIAPQRGTVYHFIISVPAGNDVAQEQYVGQLTSMVQYVNAVITDFNVIKSSVDPPIHYGAAVFNIGGDGSYACSSACGTSDVIGLMVYAMPGPKSGYFTGRAIQPDAPTEWTALPGKNTGVAKREIDTRLIRSDRPQLSFTIRSLPGDIEFEAHGYIEVFRR